MTRHATAPVVALDLSGAGADPEAWRLGPDDPGEILDGSAQARHALLADEAGIDLVTIGDALEAPDDVPARLSIRLDAGALAARIGAVSHRVGVVPAVTTTHTEPFHVQAAIATLDWVTQGRAGWLVEVSSTPEAAAVVGRRGVEPPAATWLEAADVVDASRALWDSWEDDAIIRDTASGRFVDRDRLHYVDHVGATFSVKGPSIVPRPPQGHPVVVARLGSTDTHPVVERADVVLVDVSAGGLADVEQTLADRVAQVRDLAGSAGRDPDSVRVLASVRATSQRRATVASGERTTRVSDLPDAVARWRVAGADGVHVRLDVLDRDLPDFLHRALPRIVPDPGSRPATDRVTLRDRLGLARPTNRYARTA